LNVAILGLGLIGGSIGLALHDSDSRDADPPARTIGWDPDRQALDAALTAGAIDEAAATAEQAVAEAEVVFVAAPIAALTQTVRLALRCCPPTCVVTDVGSTKRALIEELAGERGSERFIGGHPLAGAEEGGIDHARADMFLGAPWCLVRAHALGGGGPGAIEADRRLRELIKGFGAHPVEIDAEAHDRVMARISHLPHVLANVLVAATGGFDERERALAAAGPSFRDATRVAGASSAIWTDIYLSNADMVLDAIDEAIADLERVRDALREGDAQALRRWNEQARERKRALMQRDGEPEAGAGAA
jgi:prephenate dehydrogenase